MTAPHGTTARYSGRHSCRCTPCRAANTRAAKQRRLAANRGNPATVPTTPIREHLATLTGLGWSLRALATHTGIAHTTLSTIATAQTRTARTHIAERILAVTTPPPAPATIDAHGARLRVRALIRIGWPDLHIGEATGCGGPPISRIASGTTPRIRPATAARIAAVYDALWDQTPPDDPSSTRARRRGEARGWLPPMALDDDRLDDPTYNPDPHHARSTR